MGYHNDKRFNVNLTIQGCEQSALIDTGASHSFLAEEIVHKLKINTKPMQALVHTVMHKSVTTGVCVLLIPELQTCIQFYVIANLQPHCIIGRLDLQRCKATIDINKNQLRGTFGQLAIETQYLGNSTGSVLTIDANDGPQTASVTPVTIDTGLAKPIACKLGRPPRHLLPALKGEIERLLALKVIRPSQSPWAAKPKMVVKEDGTIRLCGAYVPINDVTPRDQYPLPRMDDILERLQQFSYFAKIDMKCGFWQVPLAEDSISKTAIITPFGLFEWTVLPFGLRNAPKAFQRIMDEVLRPHIGKICEVYIDDIIVYGATFEECSTRRDTILQSIGERSFKLNPAKSSLTPTREIDFLGYHIAKGKIAARDIDIQPILRLPRPVTTKQLHSFLGLCNTYRRFIHKYAQIVAPLRDVLKHGTDLQWTSAATDAFNEIKAKLHQAPVLRLPDLNKDFILDTDASSVACGAILQQHDEDGELHPVAYASRMFTGRERNWPPRELEAFAIVWACDHFRHLLLGSPFTIRTDHESLKWVMNAQKGKIARWATLLSEFEATIIHRPGAQMAHVDHLSRTVINDDLEKELAERLSVKGVELEQTLETTREEDTQRQEVGTTNEQDKPSGEPSIRVLTELEINIQNIKNAMSTDTQAQTLIDQQVLSKREGLAWTDDSRIFVPAPMREAAMKEYHCRHQHHPGIQRTAAAIMRVFWWPGLRKDVTDFVRNCVPCARAKGGFERLQGFQGALRTSEACDVVEMDVIGPLPPSGEYSYILTIVDTLTKYAVATPLTDVTAPSIVRAVLNEWIHRLGAPRTWRTDNASYFRATLTQDFLSSFGSQWVFSAPAHPQSHGGIEAFNRYLQTQLRLVDHPQAWAARLTQATWLHNRTTHTTTQHTPLNLLLGREDTSPVDYELTHAMQDLQERHQLILAARQEALDRQEARQHLSAQQANEHRRDTHVRPGQYVCVRLHNPESKLHLPFSQPYRVVSSEARRVQYWTGTSMREADVENVHVLPDWTPAQAEDAHIQPDPSTTHSQATPALQPQLASREHDSLPANIQSPHQQFPVREPLRGTEEEVESIDTSDLFTTPESRPHTPPRRRPQIEDVPERPRVRLVPPTSLPAARPTRRRWKPKDPAESDLSDGE